MNTRQRLIQQLREALHQAESPRTEIAEFDILDTEFSIDFTVDEENLSEAYQLGDYIANNLK